MIRPINSTHTQPEKEVLVDSLLYILNWITAWSSSSTMDHHRDLRRDLNEGRHAISTPIFMLKGDMPWVLGMEEVEDLSAHWDKNFKKIWTVFFQLSFCNPDLQFIPRQFNIFVRDFWLLKNFFSNWLNKNSHFATKFSSLLHWSIRCTPKKPI